MIKKTTLTLIVSSFLTLIMVSLLLPSCTAEETTTPTQTTTPTSTPTSTTTPTQTPVPPKETPAEPIELIFNCTWTESHHGTQNAHWFADELEKRTDGRIKMTVYSSGALATSNEQFDAIRKGLVDMGQNSTSWLGTYLLWDIFTIPLIFPNPVTVQYVGWDLVHSGYLDLDGMKIMAISGVEEFRTFMTSKKINTVEDFKGLVIRDVGGYWSPAIEKLGATATTIVPAELYTAFERGTVDGGVMGVGLPISLKLEEVTKYAMWDDLGQLSVVWIMNEDKWNDLSLNDKMIVEELSREWNYRLVDGFCKAEEEGLIAFEEAGVEVYNISPTEFNRMKELFEPLMDEWVQETEAKGLPGTEVKEIVLWDLKKMGY